MAKKAKEPKVSVILKTGETILAYETYGTLKTRLRDERAFVEITTSSEVSRYKMLLSKTSVVAVSPIIKK